MEQELIGRKAERQTLQDCYDSGKPELVAVYGRRRVGKTFLVKQFFREKFDFYITGAYQASKAEQLLNFKMTLETYSKQKTKMPKNWLEAFFLLRDYLASLGDRRKVVFIDELPWFDTPRSNFIGAFELFWNQWAADQNLMVVVCGSATSWMVNKLLGDKGGLHNRITRSVYLAPFTLGETEQFLQHKGLVMNRHQIVECYMMLGGTPYYLNMLQPRLSLPQNIDHLFFADNAELKREFTFLFRSLFKDSKVYQKIVEQLSKKTKGMTRLEIVKECRVADNGRLSEVLEDLCNCDFIRKYTAFNKRQRDVVYQLTDLFSLFHLRYIKDGEGMGEDFWTGSIDSPQHRAWSGYAFEQVCLHHVRQVKHALGIQGVQTHVCAWSVAPSQAPDGTKQEGGQIDLVIDRRDQVINLCEMKFSLHPFELTPTYLQHIIRRRELFRKDTGTTKALHLTFVTTYGLSNNEQRGMVQSEVTMDDLFAEV